MAESHINIGAVAPNFTLKTTADQTLSLAELKDNNVVLVFYPADWSPVCGDQLSLYNELLPEFKNLDAKILGISTDGVWCHQAYREARKLRFPLLSDHYPHGSVAKLYQVFREDSGVCERALFVIDKAGVIRWKDISPMGLNPGADGILNALEAL